MAQLLGRLQLGDLLPPPETELLLTPWCKRRRGATLKARLPPETLVAHKTGTTAVVINDAGIITLPPDSKIAGRLVLVVFVADGSRIAAMERSVAQISARPLILHRAGVPQRPPQRRRRSA